MIKTRPFVTLSFLCFSSLFALFVLPSVLPILVYFSPLLLSTTLCALIVITFIPHSGGMEPFVDSDEDSSSISSLLTAAEMNVGHGSMDEIFFMD